MNSRRHSLLRVLAGVLLSVGLAYPLAARESSKTADETPFCRNDQDLLLYVVKRTEKGFKSRDMAGCTTLRKGQPYTLLDSGRGSITKIRVRVPGSGWTEGYAIIPRE